MFPPKNETEETCNTDRQRERKTKGRAVLLPPMEHAGQTGVVGTHWAGAVGQGSLELWGCEAGGECHPPQHSTTVLRKEKRDLAIDSGLWETPRSYPALAPSLGAQSAPSSTEVLPSSTLRALQEAELSLQDVQDPPESFTAPDPLYNA